MAEHKRIGILTSGGDCAGLNAVIRAVVHRAVGTYNWEVWGIYRATQGLMQRPPQAKNYSVAIVSEAVRTESGEVVQNTLSFGECRYGGVGHYQYKAVDSQGTLVKTARGLGICLGD